MVALRNAAFRYGRKRLFDDITLELAPGNIYGLLGKNGAGKTTLLRLIAGQLFPESGRCEAFGRNAAAREPEFLADVYFVPEEFHAPALKVSDFLRYNAPFYPRFDDRAFDRNLEAFGISGRDSMAALSYGNRKKVFLSFGLATGARLVLMDEPTNGLDIPSKAQFRKVVASSFAEDRIFLISTHQVRDLGALIDPLVILDEGEIVLNESLEEIGRRLVITREEAEPEGEGVVYCEAGFGGCTVVRRRGEREETNLDLEILFNAAVSNKAAFRAVFEGEEAR